MGMMFSKLTSSNSLGSCDFYAMVKIMFILYIQDHSLGIGCILIQLHSSEQLLSDDSVAGAI